MNKRFTLLLLFCLSISALAKDPYLNLSAQQFWHPESGPFLEVYYHAEGRSLVFAPRNGGFECALEITTMFLDGDDVVAFDKVALTTGVITDTTGSIPLVGLSRISVPEGTWKVQIIYEDLYGSMEPIEVEDSVIIAAPSQKTCSRFMFTELDAPSEDWIRYGVPAFPRSLGRRAYYPTQDSILQFYTEFYQPDSVERHIATFGIYNATNGEMVDGMYGFIRLDAVPFQPITKRIDLRQLPTGNYIFKFQIQDARSTVVSRDSIFFGRNNQKMAAPLISVLQNSAPAHFLDKFKGVEQWRFLADCLFPIEDDLQRLQAASLIEEGDTTKLKRFISGFWNQHAPNNTEEAFVNYMTRVELMNDAYGGGTFRGYQTDMGRVRLQYGDPSNIEERAFDNNTYPYEIWQYNRLTAPNRAPQTNKVFIFVNRQIAGRDYRLIHSSAVGEPYDPQWKAQIARGGTVTNPDASSSQYNEDPFGSRLNNNTIINGGTSNSVERR